MTYNPKQYLDEIMKNPGVATAMTQEHTQEARKLTGARKDGKVDPLCPVCFDVMTDNERAPGDKRPRFVCKDQNCRTSMAQSPTIDGRGVFAFKPARWTTGVWDPKHLANGKKYSMLDNIRNGDT